MYKLFLKRLFDIIFSIIVIIILIVPFVIIAFLIKVNTKGPVFFIQERFGLHKKKFKMIKFRTMTNIKRDLTKQTYQDNSEITFIGKYLRRFKIDELPQFFNVFWGSMSTVGPRPCLEQTYNSFKDENTDDRFKVNPGVTSNAGVSGSIFLSWEEKWLLDKDYVSSLSFYNDMLIISKTIVVVFIGEDKFLNKKNK